VVIAVVPEEGGEVIGLRKLFIGGKALGEGVRQTFEVRTKKSK
jgi:hypothetical protein